MAELKQASVHNFDKGSESKLWTVTPSGVQDGQYYKNAITTFGKGGNYEYDENDIYVTTFGKGGQSTGPAHGMGVFITSLFLLGEMAGGGVVAMPYAVNQASWYGIIIIILGAIVSGYTGFQLGWCWTILQETWPEYRHQTRKPYPEIGFRIGGYVLKYIVQFCVDFTVFGASVAFLVLSSQNIQWLINQWFGWNLNFCWLLFVVSAFLWPLTFLGTPKDFWPVAVGAISATSVAVILIIAGIAIDVNACHPIVQYNATNFVNFVQAYGTITFAYGGHSAFPTIQHDMQEPAMFPVSVLYAYILIFILYFPMPVFSYIIYGSDTLTQIYYNVSTNWIQQVVMVLITCHALFVYFILINPISQDLEEVLGIPKHFTWKRIFTRTFMVLFILFVALTVPNFGILLNLIGGTTIAAMTYVCPGPFYMALRYLTEGNRHVQVTNIHGSVQRHVEKMPWYSHISSYGSKIPWWEWLVNGLIVIIGIAGGVATIYATIDSLSSIGSPCYTSSMSLSVEGIPTNITHCQVNA